MLARTSTSKLLVSGMCLFLAVTFSHSMAVAQQMCAEIFASSSPLQPLRALSDGTNELLALLKTPEKLTTKALAEKNEAIEIAIQDYLDIMGFTYKKQPTIDLVKNLADNKYHLFHHNLYELTGSRAGGSQARLLNGLQLHPDYSKHNLKIELDSLYLYKNSDSHAYFSPITPKIVIGPHEFSSHFLSSGSSLRHEVQHFIEQDKISRGENTLARLTLKSTTGDIKVPYSELLRADEIETHLRDLRVAANTNHQNHRDKLLLGIGFNESHIAGFKRHRADVFIGKKGVLDRAIVSLRAAILQAEAQLSTEVPWAKSKLGTEDDPAVFFVVQGNYDSMFVNFKGLLKLEDQQDPAKVKAALKSIIAWSKQRLDTVEKQIQAIERRRASEK